MEEILNSIVFRKDTPAESVNQERLARYTTWIPAPFVKKLYWSKIRHLYILGNASPEYGGLQPGAYEDPYHRWVLIVGAKDQDIPSYLSRCSADLEKLVIRFTTLEMLNVSRFTALTQLMLEHNTALRGLTGLNQLTHLRKLYLSHTAIRHMHIPTPLQELTVFDIKRTPLGDAHFVKQFPSLRVLNLSSTNISRMPPVETLPLLKILDLSGTDLSIVDVAAFPRGLAVLSLAGTPLRNLPDSIGSLKNLKVLDLSWMTLEDLPRWLPDLGLEFTLEETGNAIRLSGTQVKGGVDMSIFSQPREIIVQWFRETVDNTVANGVRVVVLGDNSKSAFLHRLLLGGRKLPDNWSFVHHSAAFVMNHVFSANGLKIRAQFWCLDEPSVLEKLQPVFFADRTLYLLVYNEDESHAKYTSHSWMQTICHIAPDAPVMVVADPTYDTGLLLEKLRKPHYNIKHIISSPWLTASADLFHRTIRQALLEQLMEFPELMQEVPVSWANLAKLLVDAQSPCISLEEYRLFCDQCSIIDPAIQMNLLQWFTDIGVCFYSDATPGLSHSVLLQPNWFMKAVASLSRIVHMKSKLSKISPQVLLNKFRTPGNRFGMACNITQAEYLLELMRHCCLLIPINQKCELIPENLSKTASTHSLPHANQHAITYEYLPQVVIHKLFLRMRNYLDLENIWYNGTVFKNYAAKDAVVVYKDGFKILVNGNDDSPLLKQVLSAIEEINAESRLAADLSAIRKRRQETKDALLPYVGDDVLEKDPGLNEIRVIVLGDGEAGKSHLIDRLLKLRLDSNSDSRIPGFTGSTTPGIMMSHGSYELVGGRRVRLNFWDFGGQEILHSMHRIFMTKQTMCVIVLNARSDTQDDRARYWLRYLKSVSPEMPVLLVLNKTDENLNASLNENDLLRLYPDATPVIPMSALKDDDQSIRDSVLHALLAKVGMMDALKTKMPPNWRKVKEELRASTAAYIREDEYEELCRRCGISTEDGLHKQLLNWFNIMGISYRYDTEDRTGSYTILRPEWVTNAAYAILFNRHQDIKNGIVPRKSLNALLKSTKNIQCVDQNSGYSPDEVDYVLQIMRRSQLAYPITSGTTGEKYEFIPMLCQRNESEAVEEYTRDPNVIEFWFRFDYLPDTLLFYLMVNNFHALDQKHIWLTGARFIDKATGASAIIKRDENLLKLYVRSNRFYPTPAQYRDTLRAKIRDVVEGPLSGLRILEELVVMRDQDQCETFDFVRMSINQKRGLTHCYTRQTGTPIAIRDLLEQTKSIGQRRKEALLEELVTCCGGMQDTSLPRSEDLRNNEIKRNLERTPILDKKLIVLDQSQGGKGKTGKGIGERDLMFYLDPGDPWIILEALNVTGKGKNDTDNWKYHLNKLMFDYNPEGIRTLINLVYVNCKRWTSAIWTYYLGQIQQFSPEDYPLIKESVREVTLENVTPKNNLKLFRSCYGSDDAQMEVFHIFMWLDPDKELVPKE